MSNKTRTLLERILSRERTARDMTAKCYWAKHWARLFSLASAD